MRRSSHSGRQRERDPHSPKPRNRLCVNFQISRLVKNPEAHAHSLDQRHQRKNTPQRHRKRHGFRHPLRFHQPITLCTSRFSCRIRTRPPSSPVREFPPRETPPARLANTAVTIPATHHRKTISRKSRPQSPRRACGNAPISLAFSLCWEFSRTRSPPTTPAAPPNEQACPSRSIQPPRSTPLPQQHT